MPDSGGAGEHRGGLGIRKSYQVLADGVLLGTNGDRHASAPWALAGGEPGCRTAYSVIREGEREAIPAATTRPLAKGSIFAMTVSGGGGWGDPRARNRDAVRRDLSSGRISEGAAAEIYGLLADDDETV